MTEKPRLLVLGASGFLGRNFVAHVIDNNLADVVLAADKTLTVLAWMNKHHEECFKKVIFKQANLLSQATVDKIFEYEGKPFDYVVNFAGEHRYGQTNEVYEEGIVKLTRMCATKAAATGVKRFIEISTAQVYGSSKTPCKENGNLDPKTSPAKFKLKAEQELAKIKGLNYVIVRPAMAYGLGDRVGLTPRLLVGTVYKQLGETMKLLWGKDLRMNTVHAHDISRAVWFLLTHGQSGEIFNLADKCDSTQGSLADLISKMFNIKYSFFGAVESMFAEHNLDVAAEESNSKHIEPWSDLLQKENITTPLTPYVEKELLLNSHLCVDGSKIEELGFVYEKPMVTYESLREVIADFAEMGIFPRSVMPPPA